MMMEPSQDLSAFLHCLSATSPYFVFSSFAALLVAIAIATLEERNTLGRWVLLFVVGCHLTPLLVAPVLFANLLTTAVESRPQGISWSQSNQYLGFCGFVFHSFLAYVVLARVFMWAKRVGHARRLSFNNSRWSVISAIYFLELGPSLVFTWAMVFVFQESMISVPLFTRSQTVLSLAQSIISSSSLLYSWVVAVSLILITGVFLILSFHVPRLIARRTLIFLAGRPHAGVSGQPARLVSVLVKASIPLWTSLICISVLVHVGAFVVVLEQLIRLCEGAEFSQTGPAWESLTSPALKCGGLVFLVWLSTIVVRTRRVVPPAFKALRSLALAPPALIGTTGLLLVCGRISQLFIAYGLLLGYSYLLLRFVISDTELAKDRVLLHNAKVLQFQFARRSLVVLLSAVGGVFSSALFAFYFLWVEDGVQVSVLTSASNLASLVRGLRQDKLVPATYYGVVWIFLAWLVVTIGVFVMTRYRFRFLASRLRKLVPTSVVILTGVLALATNTLGQSAKEKASAAIASPCFRKAVVIPAGGAHNVTTGPCGIIRFDEVTLDGMGGSLNIDAPQTKVEISKVSLLRAGATLYISGTNGKAIQELSILSIVLPTAAPMNTPQIEFRNAEIGRLTVNGLSLDSINKSSSAVRPTVNVVIGESSSVEVVEIHQLNSPELSVRLAGKGRDSVHFESVQTASLKISSLSNEANGASVEGTVLLEGRAGQQPAIVLDNLRVRNIRLAIEGASGGDINLSNIQMEARADAVFQLEITKGIANIHVEDMALGGRLQFQAGASDALYNVTMYGVAQSVRIPKSPVNVVIKVRNLSRFKLKQLDVDGLDLCGSSVKDSKSDDFELQDISVSNEITVPTKFIELLSTQGPSAFGRLRFLKILQEHGRFCENSQEMVGTYALYSRKKAEMLSLHPWAGQLIDWMTGLGVELKKPLVTFVVLLLGYLVVRTVLLFWDNRSSGTARSKRAIFGEAVSGGFFAPIAPPQHQANIQWALNNLRLLFGWFVFVQVTLCSIYLGQTTLQ